MDGRVVGVVDGPGVGVVDGRAVGLLVLVVLGVACVGVTVDTLVEN